MFKGSLIIELNYKGDILKMILPKSFGDDVSNPKNITYYLDNESSQIVMNGLNKAKEVNFEKIGFINYIIENHQYCLLTSVIIVSKKIYLIALNKENDAYFETDFLLYLLTEALKINNNPLIQKYLEELSVLNSDLVNTTRDLAKKNAQLERLNVQLKDMTLNDYLTKIPNRRSFFHDVYQFVEKEPYLLIMMDFNDFKLVNDEMGHDYGDKVLISFAKKISQIAEHCLGKSYRLGGDEFAMLIPQSVNFDMKDYVEVLNALLKGYHNKISIAYGIESITKDNVNAQNKAENTMAKADYQMYEYKFKVKKADKKS